MPFSLAMRSSSVLRLGVGGAVVEVHGEVVDFLDELFEVGLAFG
jgi:hypothetical protein